MTTPKVQTMHALIDAGITRDKTRFLSFFAPDIEYIMHTSARPLKGLDWMARFVDRYFADTSDMVWRIDRWAENGNTLLVEGYEEYRERASGKRVGHPYMGIVEFNDDGKIVAMREYFEMNGKPLDE